MKNESGIGLLQLSKSDGKKCPISHTFRTPNRAKKAVRHVIWKSLKADPQNACSVKNRPLLYARRHDSSSIFCQNISKNTNLAYISIWLMRTTYTICTAIIQTDRKRSVKPCFGFDCFYPCRKWKSKSTLQLQKIAFGLLRALCCIQRPWQTNKEFHTLIFKF